jgi:TrmH family RNA methyltransferase
LLAVITVPRLEDSPSAQEVIMLDRIQDPGNLGTILRTTSAAGLRDVHISPGSADAWSPKVLRAGMGAHFALRIHEQVDLLALTIASSFPVYAAQADAEQSLYRVDLSGRCSWIFGNEGAGIAPELAQHARALSIPMPGGAESLNVAAAVAVCLFEQVRQRQGTADDEAMPANRRGAPA